MSPVINVSEKAGLGQRIVGVTKNTLRAIRRRFIFNLLYVPIAKKRHASINKVMQRSQKHIYTAFNRSPGQLDALCGPVLEMLEKAGRKGVLQINILAGSIGAEAYTFASILSVRLPNLDFQIHCSDLHEETIERSRLGQFSRDEVYGLGVTDEFINHTFILEEGRFHVRQKIKEKISFFTANIVTDDLEALYPKGDIVLMQNVLFHLEDDQAELAFFNGVKTAKKDSVIFMDGMSLAMREKLVEASRLRPLDYKVKEIHEYARRHVPDDWWSYYYGMEPYSHFSLNKLNRYCTIFFRSN